MVQVEILMDRDNHLSLQDKVNARLKDFTDNQVIDVKFDLSVNHPAYSTDYYYATIIYKV